jgi:hypothetical protein
MTYPIIFKDKWLIEDQLELMEGIIIFSRKLASITGGTPEDAFYCLLGEITVESVSRCKGGWDAYVAPGVTDKIQFRRGRVTRRLVIHELGHLVNDTDTNTKPIDLLARFGVRTSDGILVTGPGRGGYQRWCGYYSTERNGYVFVVFPYLQHPRWWYKGNTAIEDWADMFLIWILGEFADNDAGIALDKFVTEYITYRLEKYRKD